MKRLTLLASLIVGVLFIVACGGGGSDSDNVAPTSAPAPTATAVPEPTTPPADTGPDPAQIATGQTKYGSCSACHGLDARGVTGLGKDLIESEFMAGLSDAELVEFIKVGRDPGDPANTTGIGMPAKGGNPALSDDDILAILAYIDSLE
jgi:mono/diheme cytochrome c family protein